MCVRLCAQSGLAKTRKRPAGHDFRGGSPVCTCVVGKTTQSKALAPAGISFLQLVCLCKPGLAAFPLTAAHIPA